MSFKRQLNATTGGFVVLLLLSGLASANDQPKAPKPRKPAAETPLPPTANLDYRLTLTELTLARAAQPYLVLDFRQRKIAIKLKGALVLEQEMIPDSTALDQVEPFVKTFLADGRRLARPVLGRYLIAAQPRIADSLVTMVGKILNVKPELLQRELPSHFHLVWEGGAMMDVRTDVEGQPDRRALTYLIRARDALRHLLGKPKLVIWMPAENALTLYRVATPGLPTLVVP